MNKQINLFWIALVLSAIIFTSCPPPPEVVTVTSMVKLELKGKIFQMGADYDGAYSDEKPVHKVTLLATFTCVTTKLHKRSGKPLWEVIRAFFKVKKQIKK